MEQENKLVTLSAQTSRVAEAIKQAKIKDSGKDKFSEFLTGACAMYGLPFIEEPAEKAMIHSYLTEWAGNLSYQELILALQMNLNGEFRSKDVRMIEPYGVMSTLFLAKVIDRYREVRQTEIRSIKAQLPAPEEKEVTDEQLYQSLRALYSKLGEFPYTFAYARVYRHLEQDMDLSDDEKRAIYDRHRRSFDRKASKDEILASVYKELVQDWVKNAPES